MAHIDFLFRYSFDIVVGVHTACSPNNHFYLFVFGGKKRKDGMLLNALTEKRTEEKRPENVE